ncbi:MAG: molybdenum cofactor biosynthesis protein MoaE [Acidobacteria bacterium]|nr:molybdenum cofactor biosynthesis protein MoaE [Acidobacteriota bacterium]
MRVQVLFFGLLKDVTGLTREDLEVSPGSSLQAIFDQYAERFPRMRGLSPSIVIAHNRQFAGRDTAVNDGDEIAFLPPVSGGSSPYTHEIRDPEGHFFALTRQPIDERAVRREMLQNCDGAIVTFEGVVRDNSKGRKTRYLDYECYEAMAIEVLAKIGREIAANHDISRIALVHRLGRMEINEASVVVIVTSPHRRAAFDAALEGINRLKRTVPIWKKEYFEDGEVWVEGEWDDSVASH